MTADEGLLGADNILFLDMGAVYMICSFCENSLSCNTHYLGIFMYATSLLKVKTN